MDDSDLPRHRFVLDPDLRVFLAPFGVRTAADATLDLDDDGLVVRFGYWSVRTPVRNLAGAARSGPFRAVKAVGARLSVADLGITFGSATDHGVCIRFHRPVPGIEPLGVLRHPGLTVTVEDPDALVAAVRRYVDGQAGTLRRPEPTPQPGTLRRAFALLGYPLGIAVTAGRYLWSSGRVDRDEQAGDASDLPPALPAEFLDAELTTVDDGSGPLLHRTFRIRVTGTDTGAAGLVGLLTADLDRAAPSEAVTFRKKRGELGVLRTGDEYRVRMPAPWDGPVRVVHRDRTSFRFATLDGHLEAGQIEFSARDTVLGPATRRPRW